MRKECRRILGGGLIWLLLAGAMTVNIWMIWNFREQAEYAAVSGKLAESGVKYVAQETKEEIISAFAVVEERVPGEVRVRNLVEGAIYLAQYMPAQEMAENLAEACVISMKLEGDAAEYVRKAYGTLEPVIEQNRESGTAGQFFVPCGGRFFELFSRWLPLALTAETALAVFAATGRQENYITAIARQLPLIVGGGVFCGFVMFRFDEITRARGLVSAAGGAVLGLGLLVVMIQGTVEKRRDM